MSLKKYVRGFWNKMCSRQEHKMCNRVVVKRRRHLVELALQLKGKEGEGKKEEGSKGNCVNPMQKSIVRSY